MQQGDILSGLSVRNTGRHFRKFGRPTIEVKNPELHRHPRHKREEQCSGGCGWPATTCIKHENPRKNFCAKTDP